MNRRDFLASAFSLVGSLYLPSTKKVFDMGRASKPNILLFEDQEWEWIDIEPYRDPPRILLSGNLCGKSTISNGFVHTYIYDLKT